MKITVIGASGLIGTRVVEVLKGEGHDVVAATRSSGLDVLTGAGLADALAGADALVDVTNSPSFEAGPVLDFFTKSATNVVAAAKAAGCRALRRPLDRRRRRAAGQRLLPRQGRPGEDHLRVRPPLLDRARHPVRRVCRPDHGVHDRRRRGARPRCPDPADPRRRGRGRGRARGGRRRRVNGIVSVGGPQKITFEQLARDALARKGDSTKTIVVDPEARYFGAKLTTNSLVIPD